MTSNSHDNKYNDDFNIDDLKYDNNHTKVDGVGSNCRPIFSWSITVNYLSGIYVIIIIIKNKKSSTKH